MSDKKVALVTGSATGVGAASALGLAQRGYNVVINYSKSESEALASEVACRAAGADTLLVKGDISDDQACRNMVAATLAKWQRLDALVNNAGITTFSGSGNWDGTLLNALLQHAPQLSQIPRAGIVHRLDKDTSGLLVVAKTLGAQTALVRQLQDHSVTREYQAVVHGFLQNEGTVDAPIGRHKTQRTRMAIAPNGKPAVTHYEPVEHYDKATLVRCQLETGRTHQIRVHLMSIGHPLVGDPVYGAHRKTPAFPRQALHAQKLALTHPATGRRRSWNAPLPADMKKLIATLESAA